MELTKQRKEDEKGLVVVGRGELRSGEARPWRRRRRNDEYMLTLTQLTRLNGGGGRGDHGEALGELGNAFLQRHGS